MKILSYLSLLLLFVSCSSSKSTISNNSFKPLSENETVYVLPDDTNPPKTAELIGEFKAVDGGLTTDCSYNEQLEKAKNEARKAGANLVHIQSLKYPDGWSTCFRLKGSLYYEADENIVQKYERIITKQNKSTLPEDAPYAMIYFYRPSGQGALIGYKIRYNDDTVIGRTRNNEKFSYKITDFGEHVFWTKTENKASVLIDIKEGEEYYVRCGMKMGAFVGVPEMAVIENRIGRKEYLKVSKEYQASENETDSDN